MYIYNVYIQYCAGISQAVFIYTILMIIILTWSHWDPPDIQSLQQVSLVLTFASMKPWTSTHQTIQDWKVRNMLYVWPREVVRIQIFPPFLFGQINLHHDSWFPNFTPKFVEFSPSTSIKASRCHWWTPLRERESIRWEKKIRRSRAEVGEFRGCNGGRNTRFPRTPL